MGEKGYADKVLSIVFTVYEYLINRYFNIWLIDDLISKQLILITIILIKWGQGGTVVVYRLAHWTLTC